MKPFFLITMPRSGGTALQRMLDGMPGIRCAGESFHFLEQLRGMEMPVDQCGSSWGRTEPSSNRLPSVTGLLREKIGAGEGCEHYGIRSSYLGRDEWRVAADHFSWLLDTWNDCHLIFIVREEDPDSKYEMSLAMTWPLWIPSYGTCDGNVLHRTRFQRHAFCDFAELNPSRCTVITTAEIFDHKKLSAKLLRTGLSIDIGTWAAVAVERPGDIRLIQPEMEKLIIERRRSEIDDVYADENGAPQVFELTPEEEAEFDRIEFGGQRASQPHTPSKLRPEIPDSAAEAKGVAIYTLRYGKDRWIAECGDSLDRWAERHGMAVNVWTGGKPEYPHPKFCEVDMLRHFLESDAERMVYVDGDVFVHPIAPTFPAGEGVTVMDDLPFIGSPHPQWNRWCREHFDGLDTAGWAYKNAGVWACDRAAASAILSQVEEPFVAGWMEQHHFNVWLMQAHREGMPVTALPQEWNMFASQMKPAWFHHLAGRGDKNKKLRNLRKAGLLPWRPAAISPLESSGPRAISYLWSSTKARWDELRISLRSIHKHFADCPPIHIFGDKRPEWLAEDSSIHFHLAPKYEEALAGALQVADEVLLMNDDIYFLRETGWNDFKEALTRNKDLAGNVINNLQHRTSVWFRSVGRATASLIHHGTDTPRDFSTHTPYLFGRAKAIETMHRHGVWYKVPFENLYFNDHGTPHKPVGRAKALSLPCGTAPRFLNHGGGGPCATTKAELLERFSEPAPWEIQVEAVK